MISMKPIFLWKYLKLKKNTLPDNIRRLFYLSWEDALWDILEKKNIKKNIKKLTKKTLCPKKLVKKSATNAARR